MISYRFLALPHRPDHLHQAVVAKHFLKRESGQEGRIGVNALFSLVDSYIFALKRPTTLSMLKYLFNLPTSTRSVIKALIWCVWNVVAGLSPFLIIIFVAGILLTKNDPVSADEIKHLSNDCVVLFFCSAMMAEVTVEAFLCKVKFSKYSYFGFCCSSFMIMGLVGIIYAVLIFGRFNIKAFNQLNFMGIFQTIIIGFSFLYCLFIKSVLFYEEDKNYQLCQAL